MQVLHYIYQSCTNTTLISLKKKNTHTTTTSSSSDEDSSSELLFKSVLIGTIHHQSSRMSLSLLSSQDKTDGLDLSIELASPFREKKIVFIGDSTMHKLFLSLENSNEDE